MKEAQESYAPADVRRNGVINLWINDNGVFAKFYATLTVNDQVGYKIIKIEDFSFSEERKLMMVLGHFPFTVVGES